MEFIIFGVFVLILHNLKITEETVELYRLPRSVVPVTYKILILTHLDEAHDYFEGEVAIKIIIKERTNTIVLNSNDLSITQKHMSVMNVTNKTDRTLINIVDMRLISKYGFINITVKDLLLEAQVYVVRIKFKAELQDCLQGFYRSSYSDRTTNTTRWLAITQFEPDHARSAFPCFDEPHFKAKFCISLGHQTKYRSVSNMPLRRTKPLIGAKDWVIDEFQCSVPMSTYLVAFMISEMDFVETKSELNITFRVWARRDAMNQTKFAKEIGPKLLAFYEFYFGINFPLPKQDLVAIPDYYNSAMENWGLITFREDSLLCESDSSIKIKESIAQVIAHELAHQWFGNLVTMKWWTDLWLNEGFATYMEAVAVDNLYPEWGVLNTITVSNVLSVIDMDSLLSSHPVSVPIHHPIEIEQVFDTISYLKGAVLIQMLSWLMGECVFRNGLIRYLKKFAYSNADQDDLWKELTAVAHEAKILRNSWSLKEIMDTWTLQTGYPVLTVTRNSTDGSVMIHQKRYVALKNHPHNGTDDRALWIVPVTILTSSNTSRRRPEVQWLKSRMARIKNAVSKDEWILFNNYAGGLYKVNYDLDNWKKLSATLNSKRFKTISVFNRVQLINDVMDFAWNGDLTYLLAFDLLKYSECEDEFLPWLATLSSLGNIIYLIRRTPIYGPFKNFTRQLIKPIFMKRFKDILHIPTVYEEYKFKFLITEYACYLDVEECVRPMINLFRGFIRETNPENSILIPSDLKELVYRLAVRYGGEREWDFLWSIYKRTDSAQDQSIILDALACSREVWILNRYLHMTIDTKSGIRQRDSMSIFGSVAKNIIGRYVAKEFIFNNIEILKKMHAKSPLSMIGEYIPYLVNGIIFQYELDEIECFIYQHKTLFKPAGMVIKQSLETAVIGINWIKRNYETIGKIVRVKS